MQDSDSKAQHGFTDNKEEVAKVHKGHYLSHTPLTSLRNPMISHHLIKRIK